MKRFLFTIFLVPVVAWAATENVRVDTKTHAVQKSQTSASAPADFDFSGVTVIGIGGGGGGGSPGGVNQQFQFNNSATFGGVPYLTYNGTAVTQTAGARYSLIDPVDITKKVTIDLSLIPTLTNRTVTVAPSGDSVTIVPTTAPANQFLTGVDTAGLPTFAQPLFSNISGVLALPQTSMATNKLIGRGTAAIGPMEEITLGTNLSMSGTTLNATGGGGTPGGSTTQAQFNNAGVFGAIPYLVFDGTTVTQTTGTRFALADPFDATKKVTWDLTNISTATSRTFTPPNANFTGVIPATAPANQFSLGTGTTGTQTFAQPTFSNLSGSIAFSQNTMLIAKGLWVDATNGNDGTGARGNLAKPFLTISAALAAASSGDIVYVGPGTFAQSTTTLVIPGGVILVGSGVDITTITTAVLKSSGRAGVEPSTSAAIANLTIQNTASSGIPFGNGGSSTAFTSFTLSGVKLVGVSDGIFINKSGSTGLNADNISIQTQGDCIYSGVNGTYNFKNSSLVADGTATSIVRGINIDFGTVIFRDGSINASNSTGTNIAVKSNGATSTVELHNVAITRNSTGSINFDLQALSSGTIKRDSVTRSDGAALTNSGTITALGLDFIASGTGHAKGLVPDPGASAGTTNFLREDATWAVPPGGVTDGDKGDITVSGGGSTWTIDNSVVTYAKMQNVSANSRLLGSSASGSGAPPSEITLGTNLSITGSTLNATGGGGGGGFVIQDVGDTNATITSGTNTTRLTTALTASRVLTLPPAVDYAAAPVMAIIDPNLVETGAFTISVARAGSDTINGGTANVVVLGANESGGTATLVSNGVNGWNTMARGGGSRVSGYIDGTAPGTNKILKSSGTKFVPSTETYAAPGTSGNLMTSDGTNWTSAAPVVTASSTTTFTNKRINSRVDDQNPPSSPYAINSDNFDGVILRGINASLTINAPTGTPVAFQKLLYRFKDDGTARALTFQTGSSGQFRASSDLALPTTTTVSKTLYVLFIYNAVDSRWDMLSKLDNL